MQTLLYVSPMTTGDEAAVHKAHEAFPSETLTWGIGVERVVAFIGSGFYALELTIADGDVQENLHAFLAAPEVRALFAALRPHVANLPLPDATTADMPLATPIVLWQADAEPDPTVISG